MFSFFNRCLDVEVKKQMANALQGTPRHLVFAPETSTAHPGGRHCWTSTTDWGKVMASVPPMCGWCVAQHPPDEWEANQEYQVMLLVMEKLAVVNGAAERGVTHIQDQANAARDGSSREGIVLVSNSHCIKFAKLLSN